MARKYHAGETLMRVPLHGENGINFVITIGLDDAVTTHNSFNLP
jgi:hypothetical protein